MKLKGPTALPTVAVRQMLGDSLDSVEMDELWKSLPPAMVQEVLARLDLKLLTQCRVLGEAWNWGARPYRRRKSARGFEETIASILKRWPTFCPVYVKQMGLVGYNNFSKSWEEIFDLKMFPFHQEGLDTISASSCSGSLICFAIKNYFVTTDDDIQFDSYEELPNLTYQPLNHEIYIMNVVTKEWRRLPTRPNMQQPNIMHLRCIDSNDYEIALLTQLEHTEGQFVRSTMITQIFRSSINEWDVKFTTHKLPKLRDSLSNFVYLDGVFYIACGSSARNCPPVLITHNIEAGTWSTVQPPFPPEMLPQLVKFHILKCDPQLLVVARLSDEGMQDGHAFYRDVVGRNDNFVVFRLWLDSGKFEEVSRCPFTNRIGVTIDQVLAFGNSIYFGGRIPKTAMMIYNVGSRDWSYHSPPWEMPASAKITLPSWEGIDFFCQQQGLLNWHQTSYNSGRSPFVAWIHSALQPGQNPFIEV